MGITGEQIANMSDDELRQLYEEIEKAFDGADTTEPAPSIEDDD